MSLGKLDEAAACYRRALLANPDNYQIENNLAHAYLEHQPARAERHFRKALELKPDFLDACFNLGISLIAQGKQTEAIKYFRQVLYLKPDHAGAHNNIGLILMAQGDNRGAINAFRNALIQAPDDPKLHFNLGTSLRENGQYTLAARSFGEALKLDPDFFKAYAELCRCNQIICNWHSKTCSIGKLIEITKSCLERQVESPIYPFDALSLPITPELQGKIAASHARTIARKAGTDNRFREKYRQISSSRLRIGYVSQKFNNHAGAHLIASLFGLHDRNKFEIFAYSIGADDNSSYRHRIRQGCDHFIDMAEDNFIDIARRIHEDEINILVDLGVYNTFSRTEIFALRPAPVQVSYLGYPGTSGADFYDYILTDRTVTPPDQQIWYTEKFAYLPNCYQVNDHLLKIPQEIPEPVRMRPAGHRICILLL